MRGKRRRRRRISTAAKTNRKKRTSYRKKRASDVNGSRMKKYREKKPNKNQQKVSNSRTLANWKPEIKTNDYCLFKIMINNCQRERKREGDSGANGTAVFLLRRIENQLRCFQNNTHTPRCTKRYEMRDD